jgi:glycosyltransferase involved in cell wall biosynthesis
MVSNLVDISLVITNYNREKFLDRAIRSCLSQILLRSSCELIVVDDCSEDNSLDVIKEFGDDIRLFVNTSNQGVAYSSNVGIRNARGRYFMRVDADDFLNQFACQFMKTILDENEDFDFVYCDHIRVNVRGVKISKVRLDSKELLFQHGAGVMFRTEILKSIGMYDEGLRNAEDYDLLVRLEREGYRGYYLPLPLYRYYIHGSNITLGPSRQESIRIVRERYGI